MLVIPYIAPDPIIVSFGPVAIRWYSIAYIVSILVGWRLALLIVNNHKLWRNNNTLINNYDIENLIVCTIISIIVGGRLGYMLFYEFDKLINDPVSVFYILYGGLSFHGGFIAVTISLVTYGILKKIPILSLFDIFAVLSPIGIFLGRIGNYINGELWGRPTDMAWGVVFPMADELPRHPSQIYEAMGEGLLIFVILLTFTYKFKTLKMPGLNAGVFVSLYAIIRIILENFREPDAFLGYIISMDPFYITMGMTLSIPMLIIGIITIAYTMTKYSRAKNTNDF